MVPQQKLWHGLKLIFPVLLDQMFGKGEILFFAHQAVVKNDHFPGIVVLKALEDQKGEGMAQLILTIQQFIPFLRRKAIIEELIEQTGDLSVLGDNSRGQSREEGCEVV